MGTSEVCDLDKLVEDIRAALPRDGGVIGIDGPGASGKSTLARHLADRLDRATIVQGDDFYRPSATRPAGDADIGGQFDLDRLREQVLEPARAGAEIRYQRYDWDHDRMGDWVSVPPGGVVIVEGIYSTEARLRDAYHYRVFCVAARDLRLSRGLARDGEEARSQWIDEWMPAEDAYLAAQRPDRLAHLVLDGRGDGSPSPAYYVVGIAED